MAYDDNLQNPYLLQKTTFSFQLQLQSLTTLHVQKTYLCSCDHQKNY